MTTEVTTPVYGIKETTEAVDAVIAIANAAHSAASDGKIDFNDLPLLISIVPKLQPAIDGSKLIPGEISHLTTDEAEQLIAHIGSTLAIGSDKAKDVISKALVVITDVASLVGTIRS